MHTTIRVRPDQVLMPNSLMPYHTTPMESLVPLADYDPDATEAEVLVRNVVLRDWVWRIDFADAWHRKQQAIIRRMLQAWVSEHGDPVLYYSKDGRMLGLGPDCELGMAPQIFVHVRDYLKD